MKLKRLLLLPLFLILPSLSGCNSNKDSTDSDYVTITGIEAKEMIDSGKNITILDVRTKEEYNSGHIEGAILIPDSDILDKAEEILTDKSTIILVYCRSGRRSALAAEALAKLGYTNIYDFGGIIDWEYDLVTQ